ncbi:MAG: hypothetical protein ACFFAO_19760 [Candidatus Hermodarchaeota archaeon]
MGFADLKKLLEKKNRIFIILIIWMLIGYTFLQFSFEFQLLGFTINGFIIYLPLLVICIVLFFIAFFLGGDLRELNRQTIAKGLVFLVIVIVIFLFVGQEILFLIGYVSFVISFIVYIFITSIFTMVYCLKYGTQLDEAFYKMPAPIAFVWRWGIFLVGIVVSILMIYFVGLISIGTTEITVILTIGRFEFRVYDFVRYVPMIIIGVIIGLAAISLITLILEKNHAFNAWLGIFFVVSSIYACVLMINAFLGGQVANVSPLLDNPLVYLLIYIFDIIIILYTISTLIGTKAEMILDLKVFRPIKQDGILIFLILCKVAYEFGDYLLVDNKVGGVNAVLLKNVAVFWLFIPLMVIMGLYGIISYGKIKKERKTEKRIKKEKKAEEKAKIKKAKAVEKARLKRLKKREKGK